MKYRIYKRVIDDQIVYVGSTKRTLEERKNGPNGKLTKILKDASIVLIEETDDKSREDFWLDYFRSMGCELLNSINAVADKEYHKNYYQENKEEIAEKQIEYHKNYYQENKEEIIKKQIAYNELNKEKIKPKKKQYNKDYYQENKEEIIKKQREYYKNTKNAKN